MPLQRARLGRVGAIGAPVAETTVVAKAVTSGPSPVAITRSWPLHLGGGADAESSPGLGVAETVTPRPSIRAPAIRC